MRALLIAVSLSVSLTGVALADDTLPPPPPALLCEVRYGGMVVCGDPADPSWQQPAPGTTMSNRMVTQPSHGTTDTGRARPTRVDWDRWRR